MLEQLGHGSGSASPLPHTQVQWSGAQQESGKTRHKFTRSGFRHRLAPECPRQELSSLYGLLGELAWSQRGLGMRSILAASTLNSAQRHLAGPSDLRVLILRKPPGDRVVFRPRVTRDELREPLSHEEALMTG